MGAISDTGSNPSPALPPGTPDPPATLDTSQLPRHTMPIIVGAFCTCCPWPGGTPFGLSWPGEDEAECHLLEKSQTGEWALDLDFWSYSEALKRFLEPFPVPAPSKGQPWP